METGVETAVDAVDAVDAVETAVDAVEDAVDAVETAVGAVETAVGLTMRRFFWCARKKEIQDRTLFLLFFLPESLFVLSLIHI